MGENPAPNSESSAVVRSAWPKTSRLVSSVGRVARGFILIHEGHAGAGLDAGQGGSNDLLAELKNRRLLLPLAVEKADRQEVFALSRKEQRWGEDDCEPQTAARLLSVFERIDSLVRDSEDP